MRVFQASGWEKSCSHMSNSPKSKLMVVSKSKRLSEAWCMQWPGGKKIAYPQIGTAGLNEISAGTKAFN